MKSIKRLLPYLKNYRLSVIWIAVFNFSSIVFSLFSLTTVYPFLLLLFGQNEITAQPPHFSLSAQSLFDWFNYYLGQIIMKYDHSTALLMVCVFVVIVFLLKNLFKYLAKYHLAFLRNGVIADLRQKLYAKMLRLPLGYYSEQKKGDLIARTTVDIQEVEWGVMSVIEATFTAPLSIILFLAFLFSISPQLTLYVLVAAPLAGFIIGFVGKNLKKISLKAQDQMGHLLSIIEESIGGLNVIKAFTAEPFFSKKFKIENNKHASMMNHMLRRRDLSSPLSEFLSVSIIVLILYLGSRLVLQPDSLLDSTAFITYLTILSQIIPPAKSLTDAYYRIIKGAASLERIEEVLEEDNLIDEINSNQTTPQFTDAVSFNINSFSYNFKTVLNNIQFKIPKGKIVALVGASGSGKTTLAHLLLKYYRVDNGNISIDGQNINNLNVMETRQLIGLVSQHPVLFNDSILNNIALGEEKPDMEKAVQAAIMANAHPFIEKLGEGYLSNIGDGGHLLSGGQRQRLTIARALYNNPPILVLDEATSSLDSESEKLVQQALKQLMVNRTVLVIAHRLSTVMDADETIVLKEGEIIERGKHEQLLQQQGEYWRMVELQSHIK